jgi:hypothetical protein
MATQNLGELKNALKYVLRKKRTKHAITDFYDGEKLELCEMFVVGAGRSFKHSLSS